MKIFLTEQKRQELRFQHRTERDRRVADRIKAILLSDKGWTYQQIATALLLDEETISRHIKEYLDDNKLKPTNGGSNPKLNEFQANQIKNHLNRITYLKVSDICEYVQRIYGISYTVAGMTAWLQNNGFTYKKPSTTPYRAAPVKQKLSSRNTMNSSVSLLKKNLSCLTMAYILPWPPR